jgi:type II secretory pathway component PulK
MSRPSARQKGFAMVTAIFLMSLVTMTLTVLIAAIYSDAQRTKSLAEDAQLRQLLLAGSQIAQSQLPDSITQTSNIPVTLPDSLKNDGANLTIQIQSIQSSTDVTVEIEATLPHHQLTNQLHLTRANNTWQITTTSLGN